MGKPAPDKLTPETIFVSYSRKDWKRFAQPLVDRLHEAGLLVWVDQHLIQWGQNWQDEVNKALRICERMILCVSPEALESQNVKNEYRYFTTNHKLLLPLICIAPTELPSELLGIHHYSYQDLETVLSLLTRKFDGADKTNIESRQSEARNIAPAKTYTLVKVNDLVFHGEPINSILLSPNGDLLASAARDNSITLWEIPGGVRRHTFIGGTEAVLSLGFSAKGSMMYSAWDDNAIRLWETKSGRRGETYHIQDLVSVAFAPNGFLIASSLNDRTVELSEIPSERTVANLGRQDDIVRTMTFSPDSKWLACVTNDVIKIYSIPQGEAVFKFEDHTGEVLCVAFSPNNRLLASASRDYSVRMWDLSINNPKAQLLKGHRDVARFVDFSPDSKILASGSWDKTIKLWAAPGGEHLLSIPAHDQAIASVRFAPVFLPEGLILASGSQDGTIKLWLVNYSD